MSSDPFLDDGVTQAVLDGTPVDAFEEEDDGPDTSAGYGSLLGLGASMRKKKPLLMVDPLEAENEARRVQFVAAQQMVEVDGGDGADFLQNLPQLAEPDAPETMEEEYAMSSPEMDHASTLLAEIDDTLAPEDPLEVVEEGEASVFPIDLDEQPVVAADWPTPVAIASFEVVEEAVSIDAVAPSDPESWACEPVPPPPIPHGHSLRTRIPARPPRRTFADHAAGFLRWLVERLGAGRG